MSHACLPWYAAETEAVLDRYGLQLARVAAGVPIPGSFWGGAEAGLVARTVYVRDDTPLHSLLHETAHYVCMSGERRGGLDTDAGGSDLEETAVCYLQVRLAEHCGVSRARMFADMNTWGYSFRLGDAGAWFERDAEDAREWLQQHRLLDRGDALTWRLRV